MAYKGGWMIGFFNSPEKSCQQKTTLLMNDSQNGYMYAKNKLFKLLKVLYQGISYILE